MTQPSTGRDRLCQIMRFDDIDPNAGPPLFPQPQAPRAIPPVHRDAASVRRRTRVLRALARIRQDPTT